MPFWHCASTYASFSLFKLFWLLTNAGLNVTAHIYYIKVSFFICHKWKVLSYLSLEQWHFLRGTLKNSTDGGQLDVFPKTCIFSKMLYIWRHAKFVIKKGTDEGDQTTPLHLVELYLYSFTCLSVCMWAAEPFMFAKHVMVVMTHICMLNCFNYTVNTIFL
jgi:hypothetical protein